MEFIRKHKIIYNTAALALSFIAGGASFYLVFGNGVDKPGQDAMKESRLGGYKYINPLLECDADGDGSQKEVRPFKDKVMAYLDGRKNKSVSFTSVYFRDLNNGPWFGINEREEFSPASLLKVPLMMAVLKKAEANPKILKEIIKFDEDGDNSMQITKPPQPIKAGDTYTVDELIYKMIIDSDNAAQKALLEYLGDEDVAGTYSDLGLEVPTAEKMENFMSVKNYASFFRVLFNASYLRKEISERAMELLANVEFRDGLVAGVPGNIVVSHKFGERLIGETNEKQFHDCGVVYYPKHPYLLCIMNRGDDIKEMVSLIRDISSLVYQEVDRQHNE